MRADAGLKLWVCDDAACSGGGDTLVDDNGVGDTDATVGSVVLVLPGGQVQTAFSYPLAGSPASPYLNMTYRLNTNAYIYAYQDGFTPPPTSNFNFTANASDGSGFAATWGGATPFSPPATFGSGALSYGAMPWFDAFSGPIADPYFLAIGIQAFTHPASGIASGDATVHVPEPATMSLFGLGLFGTALVSRRRMRKQTRQ